MPSAPHVAMTTFNRTPATSLEMPGQPEAFIALSTSRLSTSSPDIRLLIVDDFAIMAAGLCMLLESHPRMMVVGIASNPEEALTLAAREQPNVILFGLNIDSDNGIELLSSLLTAARGARGVGRSESSNVQLHRDAIDLGGGGCG